MDKFKHQVLLNQLTINPKAITIDIIKETLGRTTSHEVRVTVVYLYETVKYTKQPSPHSYELKDYLLARLM